MIVGMFMVGWPGDGDGSDVDRSFRMSSKIIVCSWYELMTSELSDIGRSLRGFADGGVGLRLASSFCFCFVGCASKS